MATKKRPAKKKNAKSRRSSDPQHRYIWSVLLFAAAILMLLLAFIKGQGGWTALHNFVLGVFGICGFVWPVLLGYIAVILAMDDPPESSGSRAVSSAVFLLLVGAAVDIFMAHPENEGFWTHLTAAYSNGAGIRGGGFIGALLGEPIYLIFSTPGSQIIICLLIFVFLMLLTGTTIISLFRAVKKPAEKISQAAEDAYNEHMERRAERERSANIDIPINGTAFPYDVPIEGEQPRGSAPKPEDPDELKRRSKRVIDAYRGADTPPMNDIVPEDAGGIDSEQDIERGENAEAVDSIDDELLKKINGAIEVVAEEKPKRTKSSGGDNGKIVPMDIGDASAAPNRDYRFPPITLLKKSPADSADDIKNELTANAEKLVGTLRSFGVETRVVNISRGPSVTRYELQPAAGVKISRITNLADDIALNLATAGVRIEAPIPNKAAVGIEVPNKLRSSVGIRELIENPAFSGSKSKLSCVLGRDITGSICLMDVAKMPHVLIAGTTGSGKSVCMNSLIISILYKASPEDVKMLMIDPKAVEFMGYNGIPHLLVPVVTDPRKAAGALGWAVTEMLNRYKILRDNGVRNLEAYNKLAAQRDDLQSLPQIVIFIDELADLMMAAPNEVEDSICRLAQMARAAGMHMVIATQSPRVDVITGLIKANIPSRIALTVSNQMDSRVILDMGGAEKLIGKGDMLYYPVGSAKPTRIQGCWVADDEINAVVDFLKGKEQDISYDEEVMQEIERQAAMEKSGKKAANSATDEGDLDSADEMLPKAIECVIEAGQASTSLLQRKLKLGYARAARIIDQMEERGIVGPYEGSKPRQVLMTRQQWLESQAMGTDDE